METEPIETETVRDVSPDATEQANFRLPSDLVRKVRIEAADRRVYPAEVMAERLRESYRLRPFSVVA